ncbi:aldo/keto reductase, partial [Achromobacter sp. SIMBA_011]
ERPARRADEIAALREGIALGMTLIDTAEMYGDGATEELVGDALAGLRDDVFIVSKVYPHHASRRGVVAACDASLKRLHTDRID